jgi:hypothetical protein
VRFGEICGFYFIFSAQVKLARELAEKNFGVVAPRSRRRLHSGLFDEGCDMRTAAAAGHEGSRGLNRKEMN